MKDKLAGHYGDFLQEIKDKIRTAQYDAAKVVNTVIISLYWDLGKRLSEKMKSGWGKAVVETLSLDIQKEFPGIKGFSSTNLWYMKQFFEEYSTSTNLQPLVGEISWSKHLVIMSKCKNEQQRQFYILATQKYGWTKDVLIHKIELKIFEKFALGQNNFERTLPDNIKNQAVLALQDEYNWHFSELDQEHSERELEEAIIKNIRAFLMDFGPGFSFLGNQYRIQLENKEYFIDLMLYHRAMQCLIAIELKTGEFLPEYKGKMEFYLNILNDTIKLPHENPAIGIIICKSKNRTIVEYALKDSSKPIGVATYTLTATLPEYYREQFPSTEELASKLETFIELSKKT
ncbi:MAG: PDDEXK nuclease domain-containing protein [Bacteroidia bacterium]|nr:PDDEXK nuclease domain-containing protein [Bacteroidia bacterium]